MTRTLTLLAALAVTAIGAAPASAYTPNPDSVYRLKKPFPCLRCSGLATPGARFINPGDKVSLNPQPLPPKVYNKILR
jgi:hypothetical protein